MNRPPAQAHALAEATKSVGVDLLLGTMGNVPVLVPDGEYSVGFVRVERGHVENRERWFLYFQITTPGEYIGIELYLACPCPAKGKTAFGLSSKLVAAATVALGQRPKRRDRLTPRLFQGKAFTARTRTVVKDHKGKPRPQADHYSVIDALLALDAGGEGR